MEKKKKKGPPNKKGNCMRISQTISTLPSHICISYPFNDFSNILSYPLLSGHPASNGCFLSSPSLAAYSIASSLSLSTATFAGIFIPFEDIHSRNGLRFGGRSWVGLDTQKNCLHAFRWDMYYAGKGKTQTIIKFNCISLIDPMHINHSTNHQD